MYHCTPSIIKMMAPMVRERPRSMKTSVKRESNKMAGKLVKLCTTGWA
jgi:hypothetical protein